MDVLDKESIQYYNTRGVAVHWTAQNQKWSGLSALKGKVKKSAPMIFAHN